MISAPKMAALGLICTQAAPHPRYVDVGSVHHDVQGAADQWRGAVWLDALFQAAHHRPAVEQDLLGWVGDGSGHKLLILIEKKTAHACVV